jgi:hypothetical protein
MRTEQSTRVRRRVGLLAVLVAVVSLAGALSAGPVAAASTIETTYETPGPWAVTTTNVTDSQGGTYVLHQPANLGAGGTDHPILTWGNGTLASPANYPGILNHLASWGFVVVASTSPLTGTGIEMLAGVNHLVSENGDPSSTFYQKLDPTKVGALGHSQGAGGALNATTRSNGLITSTVPIALPDPGFVGSESRTDFTKITDPVLFLHGGFDFLSTARAQTDYYDQVSGPAAKATLRFTGHNEIQGSGGNYLGYITAWFMYTLRGDTFARGAFVGNPLEINTNAAWANQAQKNLP